MGTGAAGRAMALVCLAVTACAAEPGPTRSSWDARPVEEATRAEARSAGSPSDAFVTVPTDETIARHEEPGGALLPQDRVVIARDGNGPLPLDRRVARAELAPTPPLSAPVVVAPAPPLPDGRFPAAPAVRAPLPQAAPAMCPSYGNEAAAILDVRYFPIESARMIGSYQLSDSGTMVSFWRNTPLVVLGLQGRPVYCVAERARGEYRIPAGRRVCFADPNGDFLFDRVFIVQAEPRSYGTAPVGYELNPLEAARMPPSSCHVPG